MYKISIIACIVLMVIFIGVSSLEFSKDGKQGGLEEGEVYVQDGHEIYVADEKDYLWVKSDVGIRIAEGDASVFDLETIGVASAEWVDNVPITQIIIEDDNGEEICVLDWGTGKLEFRGKMSSSARSFFKYFLKPYVDGYIAGLSYEEALELKQEFPVIARTHVFKDMMWPITQSLSIREFIRWLYDNDYEIVKKK